MSESEERPRQIFSVSALSEFEGDDEALESLVQMKELDFGDVFNDRETELDSDEGEGLSIMFYHDDKYNSLTLSSGEDSDINVSLTLAGDHVSEAGRILNDILGCIGDLTVKNVMVYKIFDVPFNSLHLPIDEDTDHHVTGLRIDQSGKEFIIQQSEDDETSITMNWEEPESETETLIESIGEDSIGTTVSFIQSFN